MIYYLFFNIYYVIVIIYYLLFIIYYLIFMRQIVRIFMALYLGDSLLQHVKIDVILCVYYMLTTNIITIPLVKYVSPEYSNVNPLYSLCVRINFIDSWINSSVKNIACRCLSYHDKMKEIFQKILKK